MKRFDVVRPLLTSALVAGVMVTTGSGLWAANAAPPSKPRESQVARIFELHQRAIAHALRDSIVRVTLAQVGTRYEYGGSTPKAGFDCSGLVKYVFARVYRGTPRQAAAQALSGKAIGRDDVRPGDLLTFGVGDSVTHVGIYVGERKFVHASSVAGRVIMSSIDRPPSPLVRPLNGVRRLVSDAYLFEDRRGS